MPSFRRLAPVGLACLLLFMVMQFPAKTAFAWFAPAGVGGFGITGTVWKGSARVISIGDQQLRNTEWDIALLRLFIGQLGGDFTSRWGGGFIETFATISVTGTIRLSEMRGSFDIAQLNTLLGTPDIGGIATVNLQEVEISDNWPRRVVGEGEVRSLSSPLMGRGDTQLIGDIGFEFDTTTETNVDTVTGKLRDTGGPLQLSGTLVLTPPGNYELKSRVLARDSAPESLRNNLNFLGAAEPDGTRIFQLAGSI